MNKIKKGLGRGLSSLIGEVKAEAQANQLQVSELVPNKYQPRKIFDEKNLEELTNSIKERGMIQPIIVRKSNDDKSKFEIIAGERRWLAAQKAGLHNVPVVITEADDLKSLEFAIVENVQRHDLNPLEEAQGYKRLIDEFSYDQEKVAKFIGKSRSHIANALRILSLPDDVIQLIESKKLTSGHAKILVGLKNSSFVASKIVEKKLSVRQAENFVKLFKNNKPKSSIIKDTNIIALKQPGKGKGDAVHYAFQHASSDILMILDGDLTVPPEDMIKFYNVLALGIGEFVNGSRLVYGMEKDAMRFLNYYANRTFARIFSYLLNQQFTDTLCGTKVMFRRDYEKILSNKSFFGDFDPFGDFDFIFGAAKLNLKIIEVPVRYRARTYGSTQISRFRHGFMLLQMVIFAFRKLKAI